MLLFLKKRASLILVPLFSEMPSQLNHNSMLLLKPRWRKRISNDLLFFIPMIPMGLKSATSFGKRSEKRAAPLLALSLTFLEETDFKEPIQKLVGTFYIDDRKGEYSKRLKEWYKKQPKSSRRRKKSTRRFTSSYC